MKEAISINGTKVECKGKLFSYFVSEIFCINGTKVECKAMRQTASHLYANSINGTKVECKEVWVISVCFAGCVLMEPKWNVKEGIESGLLRRAWY